MGEARGGKRTRQGCHMHMLPTALSSGGLPHPRDRGLPLSRCSASLHPHGAVLQTWLVAAPRLDSNGLWGTLPVKGRKTSGAPPNPEAHSTLPPQERPGLTPAQALTGAPLLQELSPERGPWAARLDPDHCLQELTAKQGAAGHSPGQAAPGGNAQEGASALHGHWPLTAPTTDPPSLGCPSRGPHPGPEPQPLGSPA